MASLASIQMLRMPWSKGDSLCWGFFSIFCKNRLELAYAFLYIMAYADKEAELLHNDLLPSNVMFHFGALNDVH